MRGLFSSEKKRQKKIDQLLEKATKAYHDEDYEVAFSNFSKAASLQSNEAQYWLGLCCLAGHGTIVNINQAALWLQSASEGGHVLSQYTLALVYMQGVPELKSVAGVDLFENIKEDYEKLEPDFSRAREWAKKSAENNLPEGQALYAYLLSEHEDGGYLEEALKWFDKSIAQESPQGYMGKGLLLLRLSKCDEDYKAVIPLLEVAAEHNMASAMHRLGIMYERGIGVDVNYERAAELYSKAAELGVREAQALYGAILQKGNGIEKNPIQAATWLRRAAMKGDIEAAAILADINAQGSDDMPPNYIDAAQWYQVAVEAGHAGAAYSLGHLYLQGLGVHKSFDKAIELFKLSAQKGFIRAIITLAEITIQLPDNRLLEEVIQDILIPAAEQGYPIIQFHLGLSLLKSNDIEPDPIKLQKAREWLGLSAEHIVAAKYWYGKLLIQAVGGEQDIDKGYQYIAAAAEGGIVEAQYLWANILLNDCKKNHEDNKAQDALKYYILAAEQNYVDAMFSLGAMYGGGNHIDAEPEKAQEWFQKAAEKGHAQAQLMLGRYFMRGLAGNQEFGKARFWLTKAKENGQTEANIDLDYLDQRDALGITEEEYYLSKQNMQQESAADQQMKEVAPGLFFIKNNE